MNLKTQDVYTTIAMKGSKVYNDLQEMVNKGQIEKRSGVITLTKDDLKKVIDDAVDNLSDYKGMHPDYFNRVKTEYLNQLIKEP